MGVRLLVGTGTARHPARPRDRAGHPAGQPAGGEHAPAGADRCLAVGGRHADALRLAIGARAVEDPLAPGPAAARKYLRHAVRFS
jgi:hypothetical protein